MSDVISLRERENAYGFWCVAGNPIIVDAAAATGPDFIVIDSQHGVDLGQVDPSLFTALAYYGVPGLIRVQAIEAGAIGRALDLGAYGVIVPLVESAEDARRAVAATRYAPMGNRSYGMQTRRIGPFEHTPFLVIQVETSSAVDDLDQIASVDGVDALYIGPADLGLGLGGRPAPNLDEVFEGTHPLANELSAAFAAVVDVCRRHNLIAGIHAGDGRTAARAAEAGFTFSSVAVDVGLISSGLTKELGIVRRV